MERAIISALSNGSSTQDFTHAESWQPKVAIFQWSRANTSANAFQEHASVGYGFTDGTNQRAVAFATEDNQARGDSARIQRDDCLIVTLNPSGTIETVDSVATFNSWLSNGIRVNWTDQPAANFYITCTLLGGADITNVLVGTFMTTTGSGNVSYTSASFEADYGMFLSGGTGTLNSPVISGSMMLGMATGTSGNVNQWVQSIYSLDNPATMATYQYYSHSKIFEIHTTATDGYATFSGFNSTGFTVNIGDTFSTSFPIFFLIIKGGSFTVGNATEPASTGQQTITTNKDVKIVGLFGLDTGTPDAVQTGCMWTSGFEDWYNGIGAFVFEDTNGAANSIVVSRYITGASYMNITANVTATSSTIDDECSLYSVPTSTSFTLNWSNVGQARPFRYCTYGSGLISVTKSLTLKFEGIQQITKQLTLKQDILQNIVKQATIKYNIIQEVTKTCDILFNIETNFKKALVTVLSSQDGSNNQDITFAENWTPKVAIVQYHRAITSLDTFQENVVYGFGFTNGTNSRHIGTATEDNQDVSDTARIQNNDSLICCLTPTGTVGTVDGKATFSQWLTGDNSGMRINWSDVPSQQFYITVMFLGGSDITDVDVGTLYTTTSLGDKSITSLDYTADFGMFLSSGTSTENSPTSIMEICIGAATGVSGNVNQWCQTVFSNHASATTSTRQSFCHDRIAFHHGTSMTGQVNFLGFNSTGFTVNIPNNYPSNCPIYWLVMKGGQYSVGNATEPAGTGVQTITNNKNNEAIMVFGVDYNTSNYIGSSNAWSCGMGTSSGNQYISCFEDNNGSNLTVNGCRLDSNQIYQIPSIVATIGSSTLTDEAQIDNLSNGSFGLNWTNIGSAYPYRYITIGGGITLTTVIKSVTLKFDLYQETTKSLNLLYNLLISATKTLNLLFSVNTPITKTTTIRWEVLQEVSRELTIIFEGAGKVTKTLTLLYNILQEVTKTNTLRFDITVPVEKSLTLLFSGFVEVSKTLTLLFNEIGQITKILTLRFDELQEVSRQLTLRFDEMGQTEKSLTLRQNISQEVTKTNTIRFDVLKEVTRQLTLRHDIIGQITKALTLIYNVESATLTATKSLTLLFSGIGQTTKTLTLRQDIRNEITKSLTLRQNILILAEKLLNLKFSGQQEVTKSLTLIQNIFQEVTKSLTLRNDILQETTKSLTIRNDILTEATKSLTLRQDIISEVIRSLTLRFDMGGVVTKTLTLRFDILNTTEKALTLKFTILKDVSKQLNLLFQIISQTTKTLTLKSNIEAEVTKSLSLIQNINSEVMRTVTIRFDVLNEIAKTLTLRQDIHSEATKTLTLRQNIIAEVTKDVTLLYNILQEVPPVSLSLRFDIHEQITKQLTLIADIKQETVKSIRLRFNVFSVLVKNMAEKLLDVVNLRYIIAYPPKTQIVWHEWYNDVLDISISCIPMTTIELQQESTGIYKKRSYVCALHIFYRYFGNPDTDSDVSNQNIPPELANMVNHIHDIIQAGRFNTNFLTSIDPRAIEVRIRNGTYVPSPEERDTTPSPKIYHYRLLLEIIYHKLVE